MGVRQTSALGRDSSTARRWSLALACLLIPALGVLSFLPFRDKHALHTKGRFHSAGHVLAFCVISFLGVRSARSSRGRWLIFLGVLLYGAGLELGEHFAFLSHLEWNDVLADAIGAFAGMLLASMD